MSAFPQLRELTFERGKRFGTFDAPLWLRSMQGLHTLRIEIDLPPLSSLQLLPRLPALRTLDIGTLKLDFDWSRLSALTALTDRELRLTSFYSFLPQSAIDAIGQCTRLQSLWLCRTKFKPGSFTRFCTSPALRRLSHLVLELFGEAQRGLRHPISLGAEAQTAQTDGTAMVSAPSREEGSVAEP